MQSNTKRSSTEANSRRQRGQAHSVALNQDDQGVPQTPTKKTLRVVVIESSDEESGAENLTAAFAKLATSQRPSDRNRQPSGTMSNLQETPLRVHRNTNLGATPSTPRELHNKPASAMVPDAAPAPARYPIPTAPAAPAAAPAPNQAPPPYSPVSGQPPFQRAARSGNAGPPPSPRPIPFRKTKFYVVSVGKCTGVFDQWTIVSLLTSGVSGAAHKSYKSYSDALEDYVFLKSMGLVRVVRQPGDELVFGPIESAMQ